MKAFISYCHDDEVQKNQLVSLLAPLIASGRLDVVAERRISATDSWSPGTHAALEGADSALILLSPRYLASAHCMDVELPRLKKAERKRNIRLIPILLADCAWKENPSLATLSLLPGAERPLDSFAIFTEGIGVVRKALAQLLGAPAASDSSSTSGNDDPGELARRPRGFTRPWAVVQAIAPEPDESPESGQRLRLQKRVIGAVAGLLVVVVVLATVLVRQSRAHKLEALSQQCAQGEPGTCAALVARFEPACSGGDVQACLRAGTLLGDKQSDAFDDARAMKSFAIGCDKDSGANCHALARLYEADGNAEQALAHFRKAAVSPDAQPGWKEDVARLSVRKE